MLSEPYRSDVCSRRDAKYVDAARPRRRSPTPSTIAPGITAVHGASPRGSSDSPHEKAAAAKRSPRMKWTNPGTPRVSDSQGKRLSSMRNPSPNVVTSREPRRDE
jgi:hypothetical protein